jgi:hypothetical protein
MYDDDILILDDEKTTSCTFWKSLREIKEGWKSFMQSKLFRARALDYWKCNTTVRLTDYDGFADTH